VTNYGALAILALPKMPERQLRFLLALETVTRREGGWRTIGTGALARSAGLSVAPVVKARAELAASGRIEYRRGTGPGHPGSYRLLLDVDKPPANAGRVKPTSDAARVKPTSDASRVKPTSPAPASRLDAPGRPTTPDTVTSGNESIALEPLTLKSSSLRTTRTGSRGEPAATDDDDFDSSARARPGPGYGLCPECRDWQVVKASGGRVGRHDADVGGRWSRCPGSGRPPVEPVPCVECGRTGVALTGFAGLCHACREAIKAAEAPDAGEYPF
jgi:hypothetical protein